MVIVNLNQSLRRRKHGVSDITVCDLNCLEDGTWAIKSHQYSVVVVTRAITATSYLFHFNLKQSSYGACILVINCQTEAPILVFSRRHRIRATYGHHPLHRAIVIHLEDTGFIGCCADCSSKSVVNIIVTTTIEDRVVWNFDNRLNVCKLVKWSPPLQVTLLLRELHNGGLTLESTREVEYLLISWVGCYEFRLFSTPFIISLFGWSVFIELVTPVYNRVSCIQNSC